MNETTKLLYMEDSYQRECRTAVKSVKEKNGAERLFCLKRFFIPKAEANLAIKELLKAKAEK